MSSNRIVNRFRRHGHAARILSRDWVAYQGFSRIDEDEFFRITGYYEEAEEAASYQRWNRILGWGGLGAMLTGGILILVHVVSDGGREGGSLGGIGMILECIGLPFAIVGGVRSSRNLAPCSSIQNIANHYNHELRLQLRL